MMISNVSVIVEYNKSIDTSRVDFGARYGI